jgi:hypothetical protein
MRTAAQSRLTPAVYAGKTPTKVPQWHGLVAWDLLLNNLATGLFLAEAVGELAAPAVFGPLARVVYPVALLMLLADLGCLVADLGDPLRFHHMLRVVKPGSPMSVGTWCLTVYSIPLTLAAALALLHWPALAGLRAALPGWLEQARAVAVLVAVLLAFGSALYKGVLLSTSAQPGWQDARWLGGFLTTGAPLVGCALLLGLAALLDQNAAAAALRTALGPLLAINLIALSLLFRELQPSLSRALAGRAPLRGLLLAGALGWVVPLALLLGWSGAATVGLLAASLVLLGSAIARFLVVAIPHRLTMQ